MGEKRVLTEEEKRDLREYFKAHRWRGARAYQVRKLGVTYSTIRQIANEAQNRRVLNNSQE